MFFKLKIHVLRILTLQNQGYQWDSTYRLAIFLRHLSTFQLIFSLFTCRFSIFHLLLYISNWQKRSVIRHSMTIKKNDTLPDFSIGGAKLTEGASLIVYMYVLVFIYQYISYSQSVSRLLSWPKSYPPILQPLRHSTRISSVKIQPPCAPAFAW